MQKGIIMEVQSSHWIVMTPDGDFVKVPKTDLTAQVGEEIAFQAVETGKTHRKKAWIAAVSAAAAAMLGMFFLFPAVTPNKAYAETYVYLDVNPSVAIVLNDNREVVKVDPLNKSAEKVLKSVGYKSKSVDDFVIRFLEKAKEKGYLHKQDQVVLSGIQEEKNSISTVNNLKTVIDKESEKRHLDLHVHTLVMPKKVQSKAVKTGLSPAKYAAWVLAKKEGKEMPVEKIEDTPLDDLANDIKPVSDLLEKNMSTTEWDQIIQDGHADAAPTNPQPGQGTQKDEQPTPQPTQPPTPAGDQPTNTPAPSNQPSGTDNQAKPPASGDKPSGDKPSGDKPSGDKPADSSAGQSTDSRINTGQSTGETGNNAQQAK